MAESPNMANTPLNEEEYEEEDDPILMDTDSESETDMPAMSGRKGGAVAAPVALFNDYKQVYNYDATRQLSESPSGFSRWLPMLIAFAVVMAILFFASQYLSFPSAANSTASEPTVAAPAP